MYDFLKHGSLAMYIDELGRDHIIDILTVDYYIAQQKYTVKVEGMEQYFDMPTKTVHCYISPKDAVSFPPHIDPIDVEIKCLEGKKTLIVDGKDVELAAGESIMIPKDTIHQATNKYDSVMISIGHSNDST